MRGLRATAFTKTILRSIRGSLGRFLAILGIVALGCGFFAGLLMSGPDMRAAANELYDGTNLYDLRLVSTLGFTEKDVERVRQTEGIAGIMPAISCDVMARLGKEQLAMRMSSLDVDAARDGEEQGASVVLSADGNYLNRVFLREGRWPQAADECVLTADKPVVDVGVGSSIEVLFGTVDLGDVLRERTFRVVGLVSASNYPYTGSFGSTTLGSGMIGQYAFVSPTAFVEDAPFTEIYLRVAGASAYESGSDAYQAVVDEVTDRLEQMAPALASARLGDVRAEAQDEVDEGREEYQTEKEKAQRELDDARRKLDDAKRELEDGERELADGWSEYEDGKAELDQKREEAEEQLADAEGQLESGAAELDRSAAELERGAQQLGQGRKEFESGKAKLLEQLGAKDLQGAKKTLQGQREEAEQGIAGLEAAQDGAQRIVDGREALAQGRQEAEQGRAAWEAGRDRLLAGLAAQGMVVTSVGEACAALEQAIAQQQAAGAPEQVLAPLREALAQAQQLAEADERLSRGEEELDQAEAELAEGERQLLAELAAQGIEAADASAAVEQLAQRSEQAHSGIAQIDEGLAGIERLESAQTELSQNAKAIEDGRRQIADGRAQLAAGREEFEEQRADAYRQLDEAQELLDDALRELEDGRRKLEDGRREYADGLVEYEDGKREADEELADAQRQLDDAQKKVDELELPDIYVLDRTKSEGAVTYHDDSLRIDSIARVFPFMFFLVSALVALTTMTRMVEDDRILIGTYKALGYSTSRIASKYLWYAGLASATGATLGILVLSQVLPFIITSSYSIVYTVPLHPLPLPIDPLIALASGGLGVGVTLVATWAAVVASLREVPATLMLPRAPASGKRILLERVGPVWRRLSFSWKVTCRNLFRYKRRLAMTVVGISGCTALLLVGFGLHDAIWDIIDGQYGPIIHYDTTVGLDDDATEIDVARVIDVLKDTGEVSGIERVQQENMQAGTDGNGPTLRVQVIIPRSASELGRSVTLRTRVGHEPIAFDESSVVVTEKIALKYGVAPGDEIVLFDQDTIGNIKGSGHRLKVSGVAENYVGNLVYVGREAWKAVDDAQPVFSTIHCSTTPGEEVRANLASMLRECEDVSTVVFSDETINLYRNMLSVVDLVVVLLIVSAGLLAFIVLYNLTNINVEERVREIASLKVLGFTKGEVYAYVYREIALLAVLGDVLGMALGTYLASFVITTAEVDYVMFGRTIHAPSYLYSFVITLVFVGVVMLLMRPKLDRVNMVESLKSVD